ncbi:hypothetical protein L1987_30722 [Smallanthus sonchifolius]|uniref:Uncharacterized protein n=1 Tax=Smallanthus sonchifolius TaxID=185202 RepID=A0ACB9I2Z4_9ASTR|nr:hypothetical protein L1987_30722 [Smallanthus sonchifolius]
MNEAAKMDENGVIEMHNYCTSVYEEGDARSALITMLHSLNHANNSFDVVASTRVNSHFAKPNWRNVYRQIDLNHTSSGIDIMARSSAGGCGGKVRGSGRGSTDTVGRPPSGASKRVFEK